MLLAGAGAARAEETSPAAAARADIQKTLGFGPQFLLAFPDAALPGAWEEMKTLQLNPATALTRQGEGGHRARGGLADPLQLLHLAHTEFGKLAGATAAELGEAVAMAALTRQWSTFLNGIQTRRGKFRGEIAQIIDNVKRASASKAPAPRPVTVVDGASALRDIEPDPRRFVPEFLRRFPDAARAGAWRQMRDVQLNPKTALSGKDKELVGLAVASQVPCRYCIIAHTEFAKLNGATDTEISEAIAHGGPDPQPEHDAQRPAGRRGPVPPRRQPAGEGRRRRRRKAAARSKTTAAAAR